MEIAQINKIVGEYISGRSLRGWVDLGSVLSGVKSLPDLRWANTLDIKDTVEHTLTKKFGPKNQQKGKVWSNPAICQLL